MSISCQHFLGEHGISSLLLQHPLWIIVVAIFFIVFLFKWLYPSTKKNFPPSPPKLPIIGNLHQLGVLPHRSFHSLSRQYGPLMLLHFGKVPVLVVSSADIAREIMRTHDIIFANRPKTSLFDKLTYGCRDIGASPYGEYWRQIRSICVVHLLSNKSVKSFHKIRAEETSLMVEKIIKSTLSSLPINLSDLLVTLTNNIVCRATLGKKYTEGEEGREFKELFKKFVGLLGAFSVSDYIPSLGWVSYFSGFDAEVERVAKEFDDFLEKVIREHEGRMMERGRDSHVCDYDQEHKDFVDVLLRIQKENTVGLPLDRVSLKAIILDMLSAGTDTSYANLEWTMTELLRHPMVMKKLQDEVRGVAGENSDIREDDLDKLPYLKAVIKETLRLHPPAPLLVPRESSQDVKINGYDISVGTQVLINAWAIGRDPSTWDDSMKFKPERFLNTSIDYKGHDFQFIPFGAGRRGCPGIQFAANVTTLALASLVNKFDWEAPVQLRGESLDVTETIGIVTHKRFPLVAVATPSPH